MIADYAGLILFAALVVIGFVFGRWAENGHYKRIRQREFAYRRVTVLNERHIPETYANCQGTLVAGNVVVSVDYFKSLVAGIRSLTGGRIGAYESLVDRARREAILRMKEEALSKGAIAIINMKFETCPVSGDASEGIGSVEVLAYGTAMIPEKELA